MNKAVGNHGFVSFSFDHPEEDIIHAALRHFANGLRERTVPQEILGIVYGRDIVYFDDCVDMDAADVEAMANEFSGEPE